MDPFDLSIIFSALRNFGDPETVEAVRGQQASALGRVGSNLTPDDLRSMFLGRANNAPLVELLSQDAPSSIRRATSELGSVNRALTDITSGGLGVQEEIFDLIGERGALENVLGALSETPSGVGRGVARTAGRALGPLSGALFAGLDARRFAQDPTKETSRNIVQEIINPAAGVGEALGAPNFGRALPIPGGDPRNLRPVTDAIADFLFRSFAEERPRTSRRSPTGS